MKENLSGNFIVINDALIDRLTQQGLWNDHMLKQIKLHNGSIQEIPEVPLEIRNLFKETFDIDMQWIIRAASRQGKWIDQAASTNIFVNSTSGKYLNDIYTFGLEFWFENNVLLTFIGCNSSVENFVGS